MALWQETLRSYTVEIDPSTDPRSCHTSNDLASYSQCLTCRISQIATELAARHYQIFMHMARELRVEAIRLRKLHFVFIAYSTEFSAFSHAESRR